MWKKEETEKHVLSWRPKEHKIVHISDYAFDASAFWCACLDKNVNDPSTFFSFQLIVHL